MFKCLFLAEVVLQFKGIPLRRNGDYELQSLKSDLKTKETQAEQKRHKLKPPPHFIKTDFFFLTIHEFLWAVTATLSPQK